MAGDTPLPQKAMNSVALIYAVCVENTTLVAPAIFQTRPVPVVLKRPHHGNLAKSATASYPLPDARGICFQERGSHQFLPKPQSLHGPESSAVNQDNWHLSVGSFLTENALLANFKDRDQCF